MLIKHTFYAQYWRKYWKTFSLSKVWTLKLAEETSEDEKTIQPKVHRYKNLKQYESILK